MKKKFTAELLAFFLGLFGVHRFYLGHTGSGIAQLILTILVFTSVITAFWAFIDFIMILTDNLKDANGNELS